jgi:hypothetical protein
MLSHKKTNKRKVLAVIYNYQTNCWRTAEADLIAHIATSDKEHLVQTIERMPIAVRAIHPKTEQVTDIPIIDNNIAAALNTFSVIDEWDSYDSLPFLYQ